MSLIRQEIIDRIMLFNPLPSTLKKGKKVSSYSGFRNYLNGLNDEQLTLRLLAHENEVGKISRGYSPQESQTGLEFKQL